MNETMSTDKQQETKTNEKPKRHWFLEAFIDGLVIGIASIFS